MRRPCTSNLSLRQWTLADLPHDGVTPVLTCVICVQWPIGPTQISGGVLNDSRTSATVDPLEVAEMTGRPLALPAAIASSADHNAATAPVRASTVAISEPPWDHIVARIDSGLRHLNAPAETVMLGVMSRATPPVAGTV